MKEYFSQIVNELVIPNPITYKSGSYYSWGNDNFYPYKLLEAYYNSPTHQSLIKTKVSNIIGEGISVENPNNLAEYIKFGGQDLNTLAEKIVFDLVLYNAFCVKIDTNVDETYKFYSALDFSGVRYGTDIKDNGDIKTIIYSRDWKNTALKENRKIILDKNSYWLYECDVRGGERYPRQSYEAALESILTEHEVQLFHLRNTKNNYSPTMIIKLKQDMPEEDYIQFKNQLERKYKGSDNSGGVLILAGQSPETSPEIEFVTPVMQDNVFLEQMNTIRTNILVAHQVTNPSIGGLSTGGGFANGQEIQVAYDLFDRTIISPLRNKIENALNTMFMDSGWNLGKITLVKTNYNLDTANTNNNQNQTISQ
jgi:hypothetical protein